jgi:hypothetical protein
VFEFAALPANNHVHHSSAFQLHSITIQIQTIQFQIQTSPCPYISASPPLSSHTTTTTSL